MFAKHILLTDTHGHKLFIVDYYQAPVCLLVAASDVIHAIAGDFAVTYELLDMDTRTLDDLGPTHIIAVAKQCRVLGCHVTVKGDLEIDEPEFCRGCAREYRAEAYRADEADKIIHERGL